MKLSLASIQQRIIARPRPDVAQAPAPRDAAPQSVTTRPAGATYASSAAAISDTARAALDKAKAARTAVESLTMSVSAHTGARRVLADQKGLDQLWAAHGEEKYQMFLQGMRATVERTGKMADQGVELMAQSFDISGNPLVRDADGGLTTGAYALSAQGDGWSVAVDSTGRAQVTADGRDVSGLLREAGSGTSPYAQAAEKPGSVLAIRV